MRSAVLDPRDWVPVPFDRLADAAIAYVRNMPVGIVLLHGITPGGACECAAGLGCTSPGKHPRSKTWKKPLVDEDEIREALISNTGNIGIAPLLGDPLGELVILDVDGVEGHAAIEKAEEQLGCILPATLEQLTGRDNWSKHKIYRLGPGQDPALIRNTVGLLGGVDVRGRGAYIVASPSKHVSGKLYSMVPAEIATLPDAWYKLITSRTKKTKITLPDLVEQPKADVIPILDIRKRKYLEASLAGMFSDIAGAPEGQRNKVLYAKARTHFAQLADERLPFENAFATLRQAALACGLGETEVIRTLKSALDAASAKPEPIILEDRQIDRMLLHPITARPPVPVVEGDLEDLMPVDNDDAPPPAIEAYTDSAWEYDVLDSLNKTAKGRVETSRTNIKTILSHEACPYRFTWNEMSQAPHVNGVELTDAHVTEILTDCLSARFRMEPSKDTIFDIIVFLAQKSPFHPIRDELNSFVWDGVPRIDAIPTRFFGQHKRDRIQSAIIRITLISAVARIFDPGCQAHSVCILVGEQGTRKSTFWRLLCGEQYYSDSSMDIENKDAILKMIRKWIFEWGEIEKITSGASCETQKSFITSASDNIRMPYARTAVDIKRSGIFVGTTNKDRFLTDNTGNRRFLVMPVLCRIDTDALKEERAQIWAEAVAAYRAGEPWWLSPEDEKAVSRSAIRMYNEKHSIDEDVIDELRAVLLQGKTTIRSNHVIKRMQVPPAQAKSVESRVYAVMRLHGWEPNPKQGSWWNYVGNGICENEED